MMFGNEHTQSCVAFHITVLNDGSGDTAEREELRKGCRTNPCHVYSLVIVSPAFIKEFSFLELQTLPWATAKNYYSNWKEMGNSNNR